MSRRDVELTLDGQIQLRDFAVASSSLHELMEGLSAEIAPHLSVTWVLSGLDFGSATLAVEPLTPPSSLIHEIEAAFVDVGRQLAQGDDLSFSEAVARPALRLKRLVDEKVRGIEFRAGRDASAIGIVAQAARDDLTVESLGEVRGTVETLSRRGGIQFAIWDALLDTRVICVGDAGWEEHMRDAWGRQAIVAGRVHRSLRSGHPVRVTAIAGITILDEPEPGAFESALGALPPPSGAPLPEERVRKLRDAG